MCDWTTNDRNAGTFVFGNVCGRLGTREIRFIKRSSVRPRTKTKIEKRIKSLVPSRDIVPEQTERSVFDSAVFRPGFCVLCFAISNLYSISKVFGYFPFHLPTLPRQMSVNDFTGPASNFRCNCYFFKTRFRRSNNPKVSIVLNSQFQLLLRIFQNSHLLHRFCDNYT